MDPHTAVANGFCPPAVQLTREEVLDVVVGAGEGEPPQTHHVALHRVLRRFLQEHLRVAVRHLVH